MKREETKAQSDSGKKGKTSRLPAFLRSYLLFFVLSFAYLWFVVEPHLIYHGFGTLLPNAPQFATGWPFLKDSFGVPGGPVVYASALLSQGYYHAWLGALIIVLAGFCLSELTRRHLAAAGLAHASIPAPLPPIMFFLIYSQYNHPLTICLAVSLGLLLSLIFERLPLRHRWARVAACCLMAVAGFWLGGGGAWLVFALMTLVYNVSTLSRRLLALRGLGITEPAVKDTVKTSLTAAPGVEYLAETTHSSRMAGVQPLLALPASIAIAWALARYVFLIPAREASLVLTPFVSSATDGMDRLLQVMVFLLYGFVPLAVLLVFIGRWAFAGRGHKVNASSKRVKAKEKHAGRQRGRASLAILAKTALAALPIMLMILGLYASHKGLRKPYVLSNYYSSQKDWDKIIELSRHLPKGRANPFVSHDILRALYHTGRLPYDMFHYPLIPEALLLTHETRESDLTQWKLTGIFLELGQINVAQKLASELLATRGHLGIAVEELAWISIIKGQPGTARVYLEAMKKDPIHRRRAEALLCGLDNGFAGDQAAYIDRIRSYMCDERAGVTGSKPVDETLAALLEHNPTNKMAFEYLMACYLLTGRVDRIAENVTRLRDLGYQKIPTLYEEAILIHSKGQEQKANLAGYSISRETIGRYERFGQIASVMQFQDRQTVLYRLIQEFGTSYFFYYSFGQVWQL